ncbi:hypothetical protein QJQ45_024610, partial [Haematococcus lacustris]
NSVFAGIVKDHIYLTDADGGQRTIAVNPALPPAMARSGLWKVDDFDLHKELYRGKTSLLYMATDRKSGMQVALKLYRKRKLSTLNRYQVEREIRIHIQLDHVNIIKLFVAFEDEKNVYMVQEFASGGDLFEDLKRHGGSIKEKYVVRDIILPFLNALEYLHGMQVHAELRAVPNTWAYQAADSVFQGLAPAPPCEAQAPLAVLLHPQPENILLTADKVIKIADMAPEVLVCPDKRRPEENKEKAVLAYTASVRLCWLMHISWATSVIHHSSDTAQPMVARLRQAAYAVINDNGKLSSGLVQLVDAWAVGILCYELLVGYPPFENESRAATYEHIMYKEPKFPSWMTEEAKAFITTALVKNASQRPTVTELARQPLMLPYSSPAPLDQGPKRSLELPADRSPHPILAPSTPQAYSPPAAAASSPASPSSPARKLHELGAAEAGVPRPSSPSRLSARPPAVLVPEVSHQLAAHGLLDRLPEALVQASSSAPGIMSVSSYTKGSSTSLQMDEDASYPSIAAALVAPLDSPRPTSPSLLNVSHPSPGPCHSQLGSPNSASYSPLVSPTPAASSSTSHLGSKSRLGVNSLSGTGLSCHSTAPSGARGHSMGSTSTARVQPPPSLLAAEGPGAKDASHFYKPAPGVLSDDSSVPVARPGSLSGLPVSPLQAAMYNSNGGRPHMAMQRPTPTQLLEVGDADEQKPSSSKYGKLFAKMWGHGGSGKAGASSADIEAFRVQGSPGSSSGKHSAVGVLRAQPGHRNLKEELLADREQSIVVLDRNGSVIGAPTMTFKQPSAAALQALRANLASGAAALPTAADNRANLLTAKFHNDLNPVGRMTSEAVLLRHGIDRGVGRSFTGANSPTMKKMANAPLVSKIHDFVQVAREIWLHAQLAHPAVIALYAAWKDKDHIYLCMEYSTEGNVWGFMMSMSGKLNERTAVPLVLEPALSALAYLHDLGIIHRDIKPENLLMDSSFQVKIADFGLSIHQGYEVANTRLGTLDYLAPEILACPVKERPDDFKHQPQAWYTSKVDCWSMGVLAYELLTGETPFQAVSTHTRPSDLKDQVPVRFRMHAAVPCAICWTSDPSCRSSRNVECAAVTGLVHGISRLLALANKQMTPLETLARIQTAEVRFPAHLSEGAIDFISKALTRDPAARPSMQVCVQGGSGGRDGLV